MAPNISTRAALKRQAEKLRAVEQHIRKIKLREAERLMRLADAAGWFDVEVPDAHVSAAFAQLVREAKDAAADRTDAATPSPAPPETTPSGRSDEVADG